MSIQGRPSSSAVIYKNMVKIFTGALALVLTIAILRFALPEVGSALVEIIVKALGMINAALDQTQALP